MDCKDFQYALGEPDLVVDERAGLERHLTECEECYAQSGDAYVEALVRSTLTGNAPDVRPLQLRVLREVANTVDPRPSRLRWLEWTLVPLAAFSLLFAAFHQPQAAKPNLLNDAIEDHADEVVQKLPLEWVTDGQHIQSLLTSWVGDPGVVSKLAPHGYQLSRIRICELMNRNYLHMVFTDGAHEVSVFIRQRDGEALPGKARNVNGHPLSVDDSKQLEVAGFQSAKLTILFVGDVHTHVMDMAGAAASEF